MSIEARIAKLEKQGPPRATAWRAWLLPFFAAPEYDRHRTAILRALCGPDPRHSFEGPHSGYPDGRALYVVTWAQRTDWPPDVRAYPLAWAEALHSDLSADRQTPPRAVF